MGNVSTGLNKPIKKLIGQIGYGISASGSVLLSDVVRVLDEDIAPIKTENRLSRNLAHSDIEKTISTNLLNHASLSIRKDTLIILDPSDIIKPYGKKMENIRNVRDGSTGGYGMGYPLIQVIASNLDDNKIIPIYSRLYSHQADGHKSENKEILDAVKQVSQAFDNKGIWVIDRGADRINLMEPMLGMRQRFIIRSVGNRHVIYRNQTISIRELSAQCSIKYKQVIVKQEKNKEKMIKLEFGYIPFRLPKCPSVQMYCVVVKGFGEEPLMLMTNCNLRANFKVIWRIIQSYRARWNIEEALRFIKQSYNLENIRVLTYQRLKNLVTIANLVAYFIAQVMDNSLKMQILALHVIKISKRMFGIPDMRLYAIADGIRLLLSKSPKRKFNKQHNNQLLLFNIT